MGNDYMKYPATVKGLADELKRACDDYSSRQINNDRIMAIVSWYADNSPDKLFAGSEINPTISKIVGKKRLRLISDLLGSREQQTGGI